MKKIFKNTISMMLLYSLMPIFFAHAENISVKDLKTEANQLIEKRDYKKAVVLLKQAVALSPDDKSVLIFKGWALLLNGDYAQARKGFEKLLTLHFNDSSIFHNLGHTYLLQGDSKTAYIFYKQAIEHDRKGFHLNISDDFKLFIREGWNIQASKDASSWVQQEYVKFKKAEGYYNEAEKHYSAKEFSQAIPLYLQAKDEFARLLGEQHDTIRVIWSDLAYTNSHIYQERNAKNAVLAYNKFTALSESAFGKDFDKKKAYKDKTNFYWDAGKRADKKFEHFKKIGKTFPKLDAYWASLVYFNQIIKIAKANNDMKMVAYAANWAANSSFQNKKFEKAVAYKTMELKFYRSILKEGEKSNKDVRKSLHSLDFMHWKWATYIAKKANMNMTINGVKVHTHSDAINHYQTAISFAMELGDKKSIASNYYWMTTSYKELGQFDKALAALEKYRDYFKIDKNSEKFNAYLDELSDIYLAWIPKLLSEQKFSQADRYATLALKITSQSDSGLIWNLHKKLSGIYSDANQITDAMYYEEPLFHHYQQVKAKHLKDYQASLQRLNKLYLAAEEYAEDTVIFPSILEQWDNIYMGMVPKSAGLLQLATLKMESGDFKGSLLMLDNIIKQAENTKIEIRNKEKQKKTEPANLFASLFNSPAAQDATRAAAIMLMAKVSLKQGLAEEALKMFKQSNTIIDELTTSSSGGLKVNKKMDEINSFYAHLYILQKDYTKALPLLIKMRSKMSAEDQKRAPLMYVRLLNQEIDVNQKLHQPNAVSKAQTMKQAFVAHVFKNSTDRQKLWFIQKLETPCTDLSLAIEKISEQSDVVRTRLAKRCATQ